LKTGKIQLKMFKTAGNMKPQETNRTKILKYDKNGKKIQENVYCADGKNFPRGLCTRVS
jgi:hypothetical protein